tara:strand:- start:3387 stop:3752 length:366 start_codon:yes stop_codon:yes gene_type:complete
MLVSENKLRALIRSLILESDKSKAEEYVRKYLGPEYLYLLAQPAFISAFDADLKPISVPDHIRDVRREEHDEDAKEADRLKKGIDSSGKFRDVDIFNVDIEQNKTDNELKIPFDSYGVSDR